MKSTIIFFIISLLCFNLVGQSNFYLKAYHNSDFYDRFENLYDLEAQERLTTKRSISDFNRFSIALGLESRSWYHEIELSYSSSSQPFEHESRVSENEKRNKEFMSMQYEINRQLLTKGNFNFYTGLGVNIYKSRTESITGFPTVPIFPVTDDYLGVTFNLIPRITYQISKKVSIDLNSKLGLFDTHNYESTVHNVAIPEEQQKWVDRSESNLFPSSYVLRFGLSYLLK